MTTYLGVVGLGKVLGKFEYQIGDGGPTNFYLISAMLFHRFTSCVAPMKQTLLFFFFCFFFHNNSCSCIVRAGDEYRYLCMISNSLIT